MLNLTSSIRSKVSLFLHFQSVILLKEQPNAVLVERTVQRKIISAKAYKIIALSCELEGLKAKKSNAQQVCCLAEIQVACAEGKKYREKFCTLEIKAVERDLRAEHSKLCESTFLQESVAASVLAPSAHP